MTLYIIGLGLHDEKDITLNGLDAVKKCNKVYLESYTSKLHCRVEQLEALYGKQIILADREIVEKKAEETILKDAEKTDTAILVIGDPLGATTHIDLYIRAEEKGINIILINNASIMNAIGNVGLELYKFGKTTSIVFPEGNYKPESCYEIIKQNKSIDAHTLCLLDIKADIEKYMTVADGIKILLEIEEKRKEDVISPDTIVIGCARLGSPDCIIKAGKAEDILKHDFGVPLHCIIVPGRTHFKEEEMLEQWKLK